jgi:hypothetical protein
MGRGEFRSFVFGETFYTALDELPEDKRNEFYGYIIKYGLYGEEPELSSFEKATWKCIKTLMSNQNIKGEMRHGE